MSALIFAAFAALVIITLAVIADSQLTDRRAKAHAKWERKEDLAEKRLDKAFAEPEPSADDDSDDESDADEATAPVVAERVGQQSIRPPRPMSGSCEVCSRNLSRQPGGYIVLTAHDGEEHKVCDREPCRRKVEAAARKSGVEVEFE